MRNKILLFMCATAMLSSCHIYRKYDRPDDINVSGLYRDTVSVTDTLVTDTANFGNLPWREVFTDPVLQGLIEEGLANNFDLQTARLMVDEAKASLMSARIAYAPAFTLAPQGTLSSFDKAPVSKTYQLPLSASWEIDLFGKTLNGKRAAQVGLENNKAYKQGVQTQLIAGIANTYYTLLMLDKQLEIMLQTADVWRDNVETMRAMQQAAMTNMAAVTQSEATYASILASIPDIESSIRETENALALLLGKPGQTIERGDLYDQTLPSEFSVGVPLHLLSNRPDVMMAEYSLARAYYNTNIARSSFYPSITLSGTAGWTNSAGSVIVDPGKLILSAIGSLTQPIFARGQLLANLKISKAQQEEAKLSFQKTLYSAGNEISNALFQYNAACKKANAYDMQVNSLEKAAEYTKELFNLGTSTYLEVLTAEQSLLSAKLSQVANDFDCLQSVVTVYQALGGGRNE